MNDFVDRRRALIGRDLMIRVALVWLLTSIILLITKWNALAGPTFADPDDAMRLLQVRDLYAGQSWFDVTQHRIDAASGGVAMHWSRLVDLPILAIIAGLTPIAGQGAAELSALIAVPLMTLLLIMLLAARISWRLLGLEAATFTALAIALSAPILFQVSPLRIDHHGWQIVCALLAVNGRMARAPRPGAIVTGAALALWLSISVEGLPLAAAFCALAAWRGFQDRAELDRFAALMLTVFMGSGVLFAVTRGLSDLAQYCDAVSPVHLGIFAWAALGSSILAVRAPKAKGVRLAGLAIIAVGALGIAALVAPQCASGGFADLDPVVADMWLSGVAEGLPIWRQDALTAVQIIGPSLFGLYGAWDLSRRYSPWLRTFWRDYFIILLSAAVLALFLARGAAVVGALAAAPLGWLVAGWLQSARTSRTPVRRIALTGAAVLALMPALPVAAASLLPNTASDQAVKHRSERSMAARTSSCDIDAAQRSLRALPRGEILAPLDISPGLLLTSDHSVIATAHHRGDRGMRFVIDSFTAPSQRARSMIRQRGTRYIAICPDLAEAEIYARTAPNGLMAQLRRGKTPDWLEPIAASENSGLKLYRTVP